MERYRENWYALYLLITSDIPDDRLILTVSRIHLILQHLEAGKDPHFKYKYSKLPFEEESREKD